VHPAVIVPHGTPLGLPVFSLEGGSLVCDRPESQQRFSRCDLEPNESQSSTGVRDLSHPLHAREWGTKAVATDRFDA
jgi:hypothetical protein